VHKLLFITSSQTGVWKATTIFLQKSHFRKSQLRWFLLRYQRHHQLIDQLYRFLTADDGSYAMKKVLIQNNEQLELVREEIRVSSLFSHPNLLPLLDHAIISVKVE
jgi:hypothetical protein